MSTDRDITRIVRSWLRTDEHESADRVLDAVLDRLDTTPQRRATWWPAWRFPEMNNTAKLALGGSGGGRQPSWASVPGPWAKPWRPRPDLNPDCDCDASPNRG